MKKIAPPNPENKAVDITVPVRVDWETLEHEFMANKDYKDVATWLREVEQWPEQKISSGNTQRRILGWGRKKAEKRRSQLDAERRRLDDEEEERQTVYQQAHLNAVGSLAEDTAPEKIKDKTVSEKIGIVKTMRTERGLPNAITQVDTTVHHTLPRIIPIEKARQVIIDAAESDYSITTEEPDD